MRVPDLSGNTPTDASYLYLTNSLVLAAAGAGASARWPGGRGTLSVSGTFNGATARLQYSPDNINWLDADTTNASFTAAGMCGFELGAGYIRMNFTAAGPNGVTSTVTQAKRSVGG